jgi:hypothetical protein
MGAEGGGEGGRDERRARFSPPSLRMRASGRLCIALEAREGAISTSLDKNKHRRVTGGEERGRRRKGTPHRSGNPPPRDSARRAGGPRQSGTGPLPLSLSPPSPSWTGFAPRSRVRFDFRADPVGALPLSGDIRVVRIRAGDRVAI